MKILKTAERDSEKYYEKAYELDETIQVESFIQILKYISENYDAEFYQCECDGFTETGSPRCGIYFNIDDIISLNNWANPYISFKATFHEKNSEKYKFDIYGNVNVRKISYFVNKEKLKKNN